MAVDTAVKRFNVVLLLRGGPARPDASVEEADRATLGGVYGGVGIDAPAAAGLTTATTVAQLTTLIEASDLEMSWAVALYDSDEAFVADISDDCSDGTLERNIYRTLHGTARLSIARQLVWGSQRLGLSVTLTSDSELLTATWQLGRWLMGVPQRRIGASVETYEVECYDKLIVADALAGRSYVVASGTAYIDAVETIISTELGETSVAIDQASAATTLSADMAWPLDAKTTWLSIINDLLAAINYEGLWVDRDGRFRSRPYSPPSSRATSWSFSADDAETTVIGADRTLVADFTDTPNHWVFFRRDAAQAAPATGAGRYEVTNLDDGPTSVTGRGRTITAVVGLDVATHAALVSRGDDMVAAAKRLTQKLELDTGPVPVLWHLDVVDLVDAAVGAHRRWAVEEWSCDLDTGAMRHRWRAA